MQGRSCAHRIAVLEELGAIDGNTVCQAAALSSQENLTVNVTDPEYGVRASCAHSEASSGRLDKAVAISRADAFFSRRGHTC